MSKTSRNTTTRTRQPLGRGRIAAIAVAPLLILAACSSDAGDGDATAAQIGQDGSATTQASIRVVSPDEASGIVSSPPEGLVILDVRTAEEFAEGHVEGAVQLDFYASDFVDRLGELDRDTPYLIYCRSGNRSGEIRSIMSELGFEDVADVDGGIVSWAGAGQQLVGG